MIRNISKPVSISVGLFIAGVGALIFVIPHFVSDPYEVNLSNSCPLSKDPTTCAANSNSNIANNQNTAANYSWMLYLGLLIVGAGSVPIHSLVPVYLDENIERKNSPMFYSIFLTFGILGPAIGFIVGGIFLSMHTDFDREIKTPASLDEDSPVWVGAWWLGMLIGGIGVIVMAVFVGMLPQYFTERGKIINDEDEDQAQESSEDLDDNLPGVNLCLLELKCFGLGHKSK